jgi:hypothetical protein
MTDVSASWKKPSAKDNISWGEKMEEHKKHYQDRAPWWMWLILYVVLLVGAFWFGWIYWQNNGTVSPDLSAVSIKPVATDISTPVPAVTTSPTSSSVSTVDWKTYTYNSFDKKWGYTFKYPLDWVTETTSGLPTTQKFLDTRTDDRLTGPINSASDDNTTIEKFVQRAGIVGTLKNTTLTSGVNAEIITSTNGEKNYLFQIGTSVLMLSIPTKPDQYFSQNDIVLAEQIINTFLPIVAK